MVKEPIAQLDGHLLSYGGLCLESTASGIGHQYFYREFGSLFVTGQAETGATPMQF